MMDKREKIILAAIEVFKEKGIEKTKVSDIVKKAEIAQGTFYLYFPSKLSVMPSIAEKIVLQFIKEIKANVDIDVSLNEQMSQLLGSIFKVTSEFRDVSALVYAGLSSTEHMNEWEKIYSPLYDLVAAMLENNKKRQLVRDTVDANCSSKLVVGLIESAAEQVYLYDAYDSQKEKNQKAELLTFLVQALRS
ncbi:TetR family transcriptional regulator [Bacillaceae bacterium IKA-2]|nr:TetR family transcriptional regulator [Bacillaceae bacterium IKA-2]